MKKLLIAVLVVVLAAFAAPALAATNPFMDVPASHWAYDSISQLAFRGVISGYPDGTFKGAQPSTRYELASVLARSLAKIDLEKASKQDVEMLKKLIVEFKDELDALGVKVDQLDERVAVLEKDLGGWSLAGEFRFDLKFTGDNETNGWYGASINGKNEFDLNFYRIYLRKRIDENSSFTARLGADPGQNDTDKPVVWQHYYVTMKLPYDIELTMGKQDLDLEDSLGFYVDNDSWFGDVTMNAMKFTKSWGVADFLLAFARVNDEFDWVSNEPTTAEQGLLVAANINANFSERFRAGLIGYWLLIDDEIDLGTRDTDYGLSTYGGYLGFNFTPDVELKGLYYMQKAGADRYGYVSNSDGTPDDSATAWKAILDVKQEALKFTSLWLEYGKMDNNFEDLAGNNPYGLYGASVFSNRPQNNNTGTLMLVRANQQWNDKWNTLLRYANLDFDTNGIDKTTNWTVEVGYQYTPAIKFTLGYDKIDYGDTAGMTRVGDDHLIRFRTFVTF
jgi:hypothetical protein